MPVDMTENIVDSRTQVTKWTTLFCFKESKKRTLWFGATPWILPSCIVRDTNMNLEID